MRWVRVGVVAVVFVALVVATSSTAGADCSGPAVSAPGLTGAVARGTRITITGTGWGDACYDTGMPPYGVGPLGRPLAQIEVVVEQDGAELTLARGAADSRYRFTVVVTVPSGLRPGEARLFARSAGGQSAPVVQPLTISAAPPPGSTEGVVTFGPGADPSGPQGAATSTTAVVEVSANTADGPSSRRPLVVGAVAALAATAGLAFVLIRRRTTMRSQASSSASSS